MHSAPLFKALLLALISLITLPVFSQNNLFSEDFEGTSPLNDFLLSNLDKGVVVQSDWATLTDSAWIVREVAGFSTRAAVAASAYEPAIAADDWLITPVIYLGPDSKLKWEAMSLSASHPDSYEVYISTSGQSVNGCLLNFRALAVTNEESGSFTQHLIDLSALGYKNQPVCIGFRLNTNSGGDKLAVDNIVVYDDSVTSGINLSFLVDMSKYISAGLFNPATDTVDIAGNFNEWDGTGHIMSMVTGSDSSKYAITIGGFIDGMELEFKFRINSSWNDTALEFPYGGPNRHWIIQHGFYTYTAYYNEAGVISGIPAFDSPALISIFPNPVVNTLKTHLSVEGAVLKIYNLGGQFQGEWNLRETEGIIDLSAFPPGNYIAVFSRDSRLLGSARFVKL